MTVYVIMNWMMNFYKVKLLEIQTQVLIDLTDVKLSLSKLT